MSKRRWILIVIIGLSIFLRFYRLGEIPAGFHHDEISQAYNSFSILNTGKDRYGQSFPILFRSFGSYQPPVYTYLSTIPIAIFGNTIFAARFLSALSGLLVVYVTYLIVTKVTPKKWGRQLALFSSFVVAISPWAIHFSRRVVEANVGLALFLFGFYFLVKSLKRINYFIPAAVLLAFSTHAYYSERVIALLTLIIFIISYRKYYLKNLRKTLWGLILFFIVLLPHAVTLLSGAFARRFNQVSFAAEGVSLSNLLPLEFLKHFIGYLSPSNLFSDLGSDLGRVSPGISVFYSWFFIFFLLGIFYLLRNAKKKYFGITLIMIVISLLPVSLTGDVFYPLRALEYLWLVSLVIAGGIVLAVGFVKNRIFKSIVSVVFVLYLLSTFYVSYFILFKYESTEYLGASYIRLVEVLKRFEDKKVIIDTTRDYAAGLRVAYLDSYPPQLLQVQLRPQMKSKYYSKDVNRDEIYVINNIEARPIDWKRDLCLKNILIIGDYLMVDPSKIDSMGIKEEFTIVDTRGEPSLFGYVSQYKNCPM